MRLGAGEKALTNFNKSVAQKLSKLSDAQIEKLFSSISSERDALSSIIESLSLGLIIFDKQGRRARLAF